MKVLLYEHRDEAIYGNQRYIMMLANQEEQLLSTANELKIIVPKYSSLYWALHNNNNNGGSVTAINSRSLFRCIVYLVKKVSHLKPSIILCHNQKSLITILPAVLINRIPLVWHIKGEYACWPLDLISFALSTRILTISPEVVACKRQWIVRRFNSKIYHLPLGIKLNQFIDIPFKTNNNKAIKLLLVGSIVPRKGTDIALSAMETLAKENLGIQLSIVGGKRERYESYFENIRQRAENLGNVELLGWCNDIKPILKEADAVILPSKSEGTPRSLVEAMAGGKPVIATAVGGIPSLIQDGKTGLLIEPDNVNALVTAVCSLINSPQLRNQLGRNARDYVMQHHSFDKHVKTLHHHLEIVATKKA